MLSDGKSMYYVGGHKYKKDSQRLDGSGRILFELLDDCLYGLTKVTVHRKLKEQAQLNLIVKLNFQWNL